MSGKWERRRTKPYTTRGIRRTPCIRCGKPSRHQWQACADGRAYRPVCIACDILLNLTILRLMRHPNPEKAIAAYAARKEAT